MRAQGQNIPSHVFVCILDLDYDVGAADEEINDKIIYHEEPEILFIKCRHEKYEDNEIEVEMTVGPKRTYLQDVDGNLWQVAEHYNKAQVAEKIG